MRHGKADTIVISEEQEHTFIPHFGANTQRRVWTDAKALTAYNGSRYFVTFTDNFSRTSVIYRIQRKSEILEKFEEFVVMAEALYGNKIAKLKTDNGVENILRTSSSVSIRVKVFK